MLQASSSVAPVGSQGTFIDGAPAGQPEEVTQASHLTTAATPTSAFDFQGESSSFSSAPTSKAAYTLHAQDSQVLRNQCAAPGSASRVARSQDLLSEPTVPSATVLHGCSILSTSAAVQIDAKWETDLANWPLFHQTDTPGGHTEIEGRRTHAGTALVGGAASDLHEQEPSEAGAPSGVPKLYRPKFFSMDPSMLHPSPFASPDISSGGWPAGLDPSALQSQPQHAAGQATEEMQQLCLSSRA